MVLAGLFNRLRKPILKAVLKVARSYFRFTGNASAYLCRCLRLPGTVLNNIRTRAYNPQTTSIEQETGKMTLSSPTSATTFEQEKARSTLQNATIPQVTSPCKEAAASPLQKSKSRPLNLMKGSPLKICKAPKPRAHSPEEKRSESPRVCTQPLLSCDRIGSSSKQTLDKAKQTPDGSDEVTFTPSLQQNAATIPQESPARLSSHLLKQLEEDLPNPSMKAPSTSEESIGKPSTDNESSIVGSLPIKSSSPSTCAAASHSSPLPGSLMLQSSHKSEAKTEVYYPKEETKSIAPAENPVDNPKKENKSGRDNKGKKGARSKTPAYPQKTAPAKSLHKKTDKREAPAADPLATPAELRVPMPPVASELQEDAKPQKGSKSKEPVSHPPHTTTTAIPSKTEDNREPLKEIDPHSNVPAATSPSSRVPSASCKIPAEPTPKHAGLAHEEPIVSPVIKSATPPPPLKPEELRAQPKRVFYVANVPNYYTEQRLYNMFNVLAAVDNVRIIYDKHTRMSKGFAFVRFVDSVHAELALQTILNGKWIYGYQPDLPECGLRISWAFQEGRYAKYSLWVGNLSGYVRHAELSDHFKDCPGFYDAEVMCDYNVGYGRNLRTAGHFSSGYVFFKTLESARAALKSMNKTVLYEKELRVAWPKNRLLDPTFRKAVPELRNSSVHMMPPPPPLAQQPMLTKAYCYEEPRSYPAWDNTMAAQKPAYVESAFVPSMTNTCPGYSGYEQSVPESPPAVHPGSEFQNNCPFFKVPSWGSEAEVVPRIINVVQPHEKRNIYLGNVSPEVPDRDIRALLEAFGPVTLLRIFGDRRYGFAHFQNHENAATAIELLNKRPLHGQTLRLAWSRRQGY